VAEHLGRKGQPIVASPRECLEKKTDKASREKAQVQCREALEKGLQEYEAKFGK